VSYVPRSAYSKYVTIRIRKTTGQAVLEVVERADQQDAFGDRVVLGSFDLADEQLVEAHREDQHDRREEVAVDHLRDARDAVAVKPRARSFGNRCVDERAEVRR
jgi:hypothetical protein